MSAPYVAVVGGDERVEAVRWPAGVTVVCYPGEKFGGQGRAAGLKAALASGRFTHVVILVRWIGHSMSGAVCQAARCPVIHWPAGAPQLARHLVTLLQGRSDP